MRLAAFWPWPTGVVAAVAAVEVAPSMDAGVVQVVTLAITTFGGVAVAYLAFKTAQLGKGQTRIEETQVKAGVKIEELEHNTNSLATQLKESAGLLGLAEGKLAGRAELTVELGQVAKGKIEALEEQKKEQPPPPQAPKPTTVDMKVDKMNVDELNVPEKK